MRSVRKRKRSAGVHFDWPKWTKSHLGRSPLRTSLGSAALSCRSTPNRPRDKPILCAAISATAACSSVGSTCPRRTGPAVGGICPPAPNSDAVTKVLRRRCQRQRRKEDGQFPIPQRRCGILQRHVRRPQGVPRGTTPRRFFPPFLIGEKWGPAERVPRLASLK